MSAKTEKNPESKKKSYTGADVPIGMRFEASLLKIKKMVDGLVDVYARTTSMDQVDAEGLTEKKAYTAMDKGHYSRAIDEFNRLIKMGNVTADVFFNLGICCEHEYMDEEAEKAYKKTIELDPDNEEALCRLGTMAIKSDEPKNAIKYLDPLANKSNASFDHIYQLGVAYDKMKEYPKAIEYFKKAIKADPKHSKTYKRLGYAFDASGQHEQAVDCFKKAMEMEEI
ncbi:MAG: tetratricopeptide repeat protein [Candidatus Omnitrophica bacterium]|nr:tetratricopeptide repeat protein [Candidatus Omnitrophota bacterium]